MAVIGVLQQEGYRVIEARDGRQALELATTEQPALALLDIEMPEMGGLTVIERLRDLRAAAARLAELRRAYPAPATVPA